MSLDGLSNPESPVVSRRSQVVEAVVDLCERAPRSRSPEADEALGQAVLPLVSEATRDVRQRLAERLAAADWPPHALVVALALDEIEVARPVIAQSPLLHEDDLLAVLTRCAVDHRVEVARRPALSAAVAERAACDEEPLVLCALAANDRSHLPARARDRLVDAARRSASLRGPLARRGDLDAEQALRLYAVVGEGLRASLAARFDLPADHLAQAVDEAVASAAADDPDRAHMERRLVEKLAGAGELRPGFLMKSLRDGRLGLFEEALAALSALPRAVAAAAVRHGGAEPLALASAAAGVDRSAFPTLLALVRRQTGGSPGDGPDDLMAVKAAFALGRTQAARRVQSLLGESA